MNLKNVSTEDLANEMSRRLQEDLKVVRHTIREIEEPEGMIAQELVHGVEQ